LNKNSVWYSDARDRNPKEALKYLSKLRQLLLNGHLQEAEDLVDMAFVAMPESQRHYHILGLVNLIFPHLEKDVLNYERYLDLKAATAGARYDDITGVRYSRKLLASYLANVIMKTRTGGNGVQLCLTATVNCEGGEVRQTG
jgi:alpha-L-fucosidase 2